MLIKSTPEKGNTQCPSTATAIIPDPLLKLMEEKELEEEITQIKTKFTQIKTKYSLIKQRPHQLKIPYFALRVLHSYFWGAWLALSFHFRNTQPNLHFFSIFKGIKALSDPKPSRINRYRLYWLRTTKCQALLSYTDPVQSFINL